MKFHSSIKYLKQGCDALAFYWIVFEQSIGGFYERIAGKILKYQDKWIADGKWQATETKEAMDFMVTELGEAFEAYIRTRTTGWTRNNVGKNFDLATELFDVIMMGIFALSSMGVDLDEVADAKT